MKETIYSALGFSPLGELIFPPTAIEETKELFTAMPLKNVRIRPLIIQQNLLEESYAISTAEDSALSFAEAKRISQTPEVEARLAKYRENQLLSPKEKYEKLEFENIEAVEGAIGDVSFDNLSIPLLTDLHYQLTAGLDDYAKSIGISHYHSGELRKTDTTRVGKIRQYIPPSHLKIRGLIEALFNEFRNRKTITLPDILEFHILLYAIHPFSNGNKRVIRILETMLLSHYGYSAGRTISLAVYYTDHKIESNFFILESLKSRETTPFVNFALRGYFYVGNRLFDIALQKHLENYREAFDRFVELNIPRTKRDKYGKALKTVWGLHGLFTHGDFVRQMKKYGCTLGVSQEVLKKLKQEGLIRHKGQTYFIGDIFEINEFAKKLAKLLSRYSISMG